jgi:hypothetical protein
MSSPLLARLMVTAVAAGQGIAPLFIDFNRTHATNPLWPGHARFHVVWQTLTMTALAVAEAALLWWIAPGERWVFFLATLLTSTPIVAFLLAMFGRAIYAGTLHDENGIRPVRLRIAGAIREIDMNAVLVLVGAAVLVIAVLIY